MQAAPTSPASTARHARRRFSTRSRRSWPRLAARELGRPLPVIVQTTLGLDCLAPYGVSADDVAKTLDAFGADIIGLSCSVGPQTILDAIEKMVPATRRKLSAQPNAGMPREVG